MITHRTRRGRTGARSAHRAIEDADRFDALVDKILAGRAVEDREIPRRLRVFVDVATLLARYRIGRRR